MQSARREIKEEKKWFVKTFDGIEDFVCGVSWCHAIMQRAAPPCSWFKRN